ncbi:MAG: ABC transporter permease [Gemmatimonas sp.]
MPEQFNWRDAVRSRVSTFGLHPSAEADVVEEVTEHLESQYLELVPRIGADAARAQLLAELNDREFDETAPLLQKREHIPPTRVLGASSFWRDVRYSFRSFRRTPATLFAGATALALGIGLTTLMFSVIYGLLLRGLPYQRSENIATIFRADPQDRGQEDLVPFSDFVRYKSTQRTFAALGGYASATVNVSGGQDAERARVARVTAGFLDVTGVQPIVGRIFGVDDNIVGAPATAVLSFAMWRDRYQLDSTVVGQSINLNGRPFTIIGVMPERFEFPQRERMWVSLQLDPAQFSAGQGLGLTLVGKIRTGISFETANHDLASISKQLAKENADTAAVRDFARPYVRAMVPTRVYALLYAMFAAVLLVLMVSCANVANLLLDRISNRSRENAIRVALGASRGAIFRQTLIESGVVAAYASILGVILAQGGIVAFNRWAADIRADLPFWMDVRLHVPVMLFVIAIATVASLLAGIVPAVLSSRVDPGASLKLGAHVSSTRRVARIGNAFVVLEIALSSALLLTAGFVTTSIVRINDLNPRFRTQDIFTARVTALTKDSAINKTRFEAIESALANTPGIGGVYLGNGIPGTGWSGTRVAIEGRTYDKPRNRPSSRWLAVTPGFFSTFDVAVTRGRAITSADREGTLRVAVVSETFVQRHFPREDPVGKRIRLGDDAVAEWATIVGVVPTMFADSPDGNWPTEVITALWQERQFNNVAIALRGPEESVSLVALRKVLARVAPDVPVSDAATMPELLSRATWPNRVFGGMFVIFAIVALLLAAIGLYAIVSISVGRRTREMGVRLALGATHANVVGIICREGMKQSTIGIAIGFALGAALTQLGRAALFEVKPGDPTVIIAVACVLAATSLVASLMPALAATRVDPARALRAD